jgi:hypothetical protein
MSVTRFPNGANFVYQPPGYQPYGFQAGPDEPTWWNGQNPLLPKADAFNVDALTHAIFKITLPLHQAALPTVLRECRKRFSGS